jgi:adenylate cyclase
MAVFGEIPAVAVKKFDKKNHSGNPAEKVDFLRAPTPNAQYRLRGANSYVCTCAAVEFAATMNAIPPSATATPAARDALAWPGQRKPDPDAVRAELQRVLNSELFRRSPRHRQFLHYVVEQALSGEFDSLKEITIGVVVFGRRASTFDPQLDPIVRVEAGRLREKLGRFYRSAEGQSDVEISLPKGAYVPQFSVRRSRAEETDAPPSVAVLPFVQFGGEAADAGLGYALAEELIEALVRLPGVKVVARTSSFQFRHATKDVRAIGRALNVGHVVEGSIQRNGNRLRCIAQLVRAADGFHDWSGRFDVGGDDVFAAQDAAVRKIADGLADWFALRGATAATRAATAIGVLPKGVPNVAARDSFHHGRYLAHQRSLEAYPKAIVHFRRAIALDPEFAQAHAALALALLNLAGMVAAPSRLYVPDAKSAAEHALALDPGLPEAQAALAAIHQRFEFDWPRAEALFARAVATAPNSVYVLSGYAMALMCRGRFDEAAQAIEHALEVDPLNIGLRSVYAQFLSYRGLFDAAEEELVALLEMDPRHAYSRVVLGNNYLYWRKPVEALEHYRQVIAMVPGHASAYLGAVNALALAGRSDDARVELARTRALFAQGYMSPLHAAATYATLRDAEGMYAALEEAVALGDFLFCTLPIDPLFRAYRRDERWLALLSRYGLASSAGSLQLE